MTTFVQTYESHVNADTPRAVACWMAAIMTHYKNFPGRPCFLHERMEAWLDARMLNPTTGLFYGIREDWSW